MSKDNVKSAPAATTERDAALEMKAINEEYKIWKKNTPFLYDLVMTHVLEWPSLTVQWFPDKVSPPGKDFTIQRLLLGTHAEDKNYVMIAEVKLPKPASELSSSGNDTSREVVGGFGVTSGKIEIVERIVHEGEVNRARYMPQNPNVIATKTPSEEVFIFDRTKHESKPAETAKCTPQLRLVGHEKEGYGLAWSSHREGHLISGAEDRLICLWDIGAGSSSRETEVKALSIFRGHTDVVEDVAWHPEDPNVFYSCGDDHKIMVWDTRTASKPVQVVTGHNAEINCLSFNALTSNILATGSSDRTAAMWDCRALEQKLHSFEIHTDQVYNVAWAPFADNILASCSSDRRVAIWDISRIGEEQTPEDAEDGPPELLFLHGGHTDKLADFSWNPNDDWVVASVADDSVLQIWQIAEAIREDDDDADEDEDIDPKDLE